MTCTLKRWLWASGKFLSRCYFQKRNARRTQFQLHTAFCQNLHTQSSRKKESNASIDGQEGKNVLLAKKVMNKPIRNQGSDPPQGGEGRRILSCHHITIKFTRIPWGSVISLWYPVFNKLVMFDTMSLYHVRMGSNDYIHAERQQVFVYINLVGEWS